MFSLMKFSEKVKGRLWEIIDEMNANVPVYYTHPEKDFTQRKNEILLQWQSLSFRWKDSL